MKRFSAALSLFVFCASFAPPLLVPGPLAAKTQAKPKAVKSAKATKARTTKSAVAKAAKPAAIPPLPDRNPNRVADAAAAPPALSAPAAAVAPSAPAAAEMTGSIDTQPSVEQTPQAGAASVDDKPASSANVTIVPLPDRNPKHPISAPLAAAPVPAEPLGAVPPAPANDVVSFPTPPPPKLNYAEVLKPLLDYQLSSSDSANLKNALSASYRGDDAGAHAAVARIQDQAARKLATWFEYRNGDFDAPAEAIEAFRLANPQWPGQEELRERAEIALFISDPSPEKVRAFFGGGTPLTGAGKAALASAYLKENNSAAARELVVSAWRDYQLNATVEKRILDRFGSMLTAEDHQARIDKLLFPDSKATAEVALRVSKLLPAGEQKKVAARIAVVKRGANAGKLLDALPASATDGDVGLLYNRIQWLRRKDRDQEAWKMLLDVPSEPAQLIDADGWWEERRLNCRIALNAGQARIAYNIASQHGPISGDAYAEAEFLAGWVALRFLGEPKTALEHFLALRAAAKGSKNLALAEYWLGRTALALDDNGSAFVHFHAAAKYPQYYYGQLGRQALDAKPANLAVTPTPVPTGADIQSFFANDAVRAIGIALASDMDRVTPQFFLSLSRKLTNPAEVVLLAELAKATDNPQLALRLAKIAFNRDLPVGDYALPIGVLAILQEPSHRPCRPRSRACVVAAGKRVQRRGQEPGRRQRLDAAHARHRQGRCQGL